MHTIHIYNPAGAMIGTVTRYAGIEYTRVINGAGWVSLTVSRGEIDDAILRADNLVEVVHSANGRTQRASIALMRKFTEREGKIIVGGYDINRLLWRRYALSPADSTRAIVSAKHADDALKYIVRMHAADSASAKRKISGLSVAADIGAAPVVSKQFAWRHLPDVIRDICEMSAHAGTRLYWWLEPMTVNTWTFVTSTLQPGTDRTSGAATVTVSESMGNIDNPVLTRDYTDEATYVLAGGQGDLSQRAQVIVEDATRSGRSRWGLRERFRDARNAETSAALTSAANQELAAGRPRLSLRCNVRNTPTSRYGIDWGFGDRVIVEYGGYRGEGVISALHVMDNNGAERIEARIEVDDEL